MALYHRNSEKRRIFNELRRQQEEVIGSLCRLGSRPPSPKTQMEQEKRIRREIANSNERRRMQSINAGFQSLHALLPHHEGEKLSKAAILQQTAEYIYQLEQEKARLLAQNCQLKRLLSSQMNMESDGNSSDSPLPKRKKTDTESSDEGIGNMSPAGDADNAPEEMKREMIDLRVQLDRERKMRIMLEEQTQNLETLIYPGQAQEVDPHNPVEQSSPKQYSFICAEGNSSTPIIELKQSEGNSSEGPVLLSKRSYYHVDLPEDLSGKSPTPIEPTSSSELDILDPSVRTSKTTSNATELCRSSLRPTRAEKSAHDIASAQPYPASSTSRQNLETIVEAIRHLEGDHMFRDDPEPLKNLQSQITISDSVSSHEFKPAFYHVHQRANINNVHHQVIHCSSVTQARPGVIVSNHS
ncbi:transcription factor AP-4-like isoform X2 [Limulus polyphemus]|uniref:Transcription factor AP-4-like isoform X2 n=1 Tax=Limulus polyphemus TaxID=6850 RepID=A0ABM1TCC9_LIMPO|nr:transcription factor AP-4-like isoform X2 [Limulus polyphemus]